MANSSFPSRRRPHRLIAAGLLATSLALTSCGSNDDPAPQDAPAVEGPVGLPVDAAKVTVDSLGDDPSHAQKLAFKDVGGKEGSLATVSVTDGFTQKALKPDAVKTTAPSAEDLTAQLTADDPDSVSTVTLPLSGGTSKAEEARPESQQRDATRSVHMDTGKPTIDGGGVSGIDAASAEGFRIGWRATDDGQVSTIMLAAPEDATDAGRATVEKAAMSMLSLPVIFPADPVSEGASWKVETRVPGEATLLQTTTYTLNSIDGDKVGLDVSVEQRPALGALELDAVDDAKAEGAQGSAGDAPKGTLKVENSSTTTSRGSLTVDLTKPVPSEGEVAFATRVVYGGDSNVKIVQDSLSKLTFG